MSRPAQHPASTSDARKRATATLTVGTWNVGNGTNQDGRELVRQVDALALQEASDQDRMIAALITEGCRVIRPDQLGAPATPLVYNPAVLLLTRPLVMPMLWGGDLEVGPGTGPDRSKPKWLIGGYFIHKPSRRRVAIASTHRVPGQRLGNRREVAASLHALRVAKTFEGYTGVPVVGGDWNAEPDRHSLRQLRHEDWTCDQLAGRRIPTHGGWCPDHVWWRKDDRIRFRSHDTLSNGSDHDALVVQFALTIRTGGTR